MQDINNTNDPQKKYRLGMLSKKYFTGGLKPVSSAKSLLGLQSQCVTKAHLLVIVLEKNI